MSDEKLQKVLARAGLGSRREIEGWIKAGRVSVNGSVATLGDRVTGEEVLRVDGKPISGPQRDRVFKPRVLLYHKPAGEICARRDPEGRRTVFESLPGIRHGRWVVVGRLDLNTSGLLLFTSDGELANRLMHPSSGIEREYAVRVLGEVTPEMLRNLQEGVTLDGSIARFSSLRHSGGEGANQWFHVTLSEGRYREVRRLWESQGLTVSRLVRVRFGPLVLPRTLRAGQWMELDEEALASLGVEPPTAPEGDKGRTHKRRVTKRRPTGRPARTQGAQARGAGSKRRRQPTR